MSKDVEIKPGQWWKYNEHDNYFHLVTCVSGGDVHVVDYIKREPFGPEVRIMPNSDIYWKFYCTLCSPPLWSYTQERYQKLKDSGMMYEWYPEATGDYATDCDGGKYAVENDYREGHLNGQELLFGQEIKSKEDEEFEFDNSD